MKSTSYPTCRTEHQRMELNPRAIPQQTAVQTAVSQVQSDFPERGTSSLPLTTGGGKPRERQKKWKGEEEKGIKENTIPGVQGLHGVGPPRPFILSLMEGKRTFPFIYFMNFLTGIGHPGLGKNSLTLNLLEESEPGSLASALSLRPTGSLLWILPSLVANESTLLARSCLKTSQPQSFCQLTARLLVLARNVP